MLDKGLDQVRDCLNKANACQNDTWQTWRYARGPNRLALVGYKYAFKVSAFLIFDEVSYVRLPRWIERPEFQLRDGSSLTVANWAPDDRDLDHQHVVALWTRTAEYFLFCRGVRFYPVPKGAL